MDNKKDANWGKGIFTLSLDTELAWGMFDKPASLIRNKRYFDNARQAIDGIIELLERYQLSATWAIVGSLLLDEPFFEEGTIKKILKDLNAEAKAQYLDFLKQESLWLGKDILSKIKSCSIPQEIGSHSFSHIIFGDREVTSETASSDLLNGMEILKQHGVTPVSFVFPRNNINYLSEVAKIGFKAYRGLEPSWYAGLPGKLKKACHILDQSLAIAPPVTEPSINGGLVNIPVSMLYLPMHGFRRYVPLKSRVLKARKGIKKAIAKKKIYHLWFHPFNIATEQRRLLKGLEMIFAEVAKERDREKLEVLTMGEIAKRVFAL